MESQNQRRKYVTAGGVKVPGVTTVLSVMDKPALLFWSAEMGALDMRERIANLVETSTVITGDLIRQMEPNKSAHRQVAKKAADIGTLAHFLAECYVRDMEPCFDGADISQDTMEAAQASFQKFQWWWDSKSFKLVASEHVIICEEFMVGGTMDILAENVEGLNQVDLKTSKAIYDEMKIQVSAYERIHFITGGNLIKKNTICRIGKTESNDFETNDLTQDEMVWGWEVFKAANTLYKALKTK